jgi:hypothetical protein
MICSFRALFFQGFVLSGLPLSLLGPSFIEPDLPSTLQPSPSSINPTRSYAFIHVFAMDLGKAFKTVTQEQPHVE